MGVEAPRAALLSHYEAVRPTGDDGDDGNVTRVASWAGGVYAAENPTLITDASGNKTTRSYARSGGSG